MLRWLGDVEDPADGDSASVANAANDALARAGAAHPRVQPPGKIRHLDRLARAGLPVPRGFFLPLGEVWADHHESRMDAAFERAAHGLLASGPVLVRSALAFEDDGDFSGAGVGHSRRCGDLPAIADALRSLHRDAEAAREMPTPRAHEAPWVLVQAWCRADHLGVLFVSRGAAPARETTPTASAASAVSDSNTRPRISGSALTGPLEVADVPYVEHDSATRPAGQHEPANFDTWIELHVPNADALASGADPVWTGPVPALQHPARSALDALLDALLATWTSAGDAVELDAGDAVGFESAGASFESAGAGFGSGSASFESAGAGFGYGSAGFESAGAGFESGGELELVLDGHALRVVQARPLPADRFVSRAAPASAIPAGLWRLDVEHNPTRLSAAHAWVIARLQDDRSPDLVVLDGWLYERVPPGPLRDTTTRAEGNPTPVEGIRPREALESLLSETLPTRLREASTIIERLATCDAADWNSLRDEALAHLRRCIDEHRALASARAGAGFDAQARFVTRRVLELTCALLPTAWDFAAPLLVPTNDDASGKALDGGAPASLASLASMVSVQLRTALRPEETAEALANTPPARALRVDLLALDETRAKSCLVELDDLLYAAGQLPLRAAWLRAAALLGTSEDVTFAMDGDQVTNALRTAPTTHPPLATSPRSATTPPAEVLWDGRAHPSPSIRRARFSAGVRFTGPLRRRADLDDLQQRPCGPGDVVWLPTLLPQAALLLHAQGVQVVVTDHGGASSHGARMAWELGLTALLGIGARPHLDEGDVVSVDPTTGQLTAVADDTLLIRSR